MPIRVTPRISPHRALRLPFLPVQSLFSVVAGSSLSLLDESDVFLDELDDISRTATVSQSRRSINPNPSNNTNNPSTARRNHSPQKPQTLLIPSPADFDLSDLTSQDFMDVSGSGNTTKRKAQNRAAQRAFRERKERHVKELEAKVSELEAVTKRMQEENEKLRGKVTKLESENNVLKGSNTTFTFPVLSPDLLSPFPAIDFPPPSIVPSSLSLLVALSLLLSHPLFRFPATLPSLPLSPSLFLHVSFRRDVLLLSASCICTFNIPRI